MLGMVIYTYTHIYTCKWVYKYDAHAFPTQEIGQALPAAGMPVKLVFIGGPAYCLGTHCLPRSPLTWCSIAVSGAVAPGRVGAHVGDIPLFNHPGGRGGSLSKSQNHSLTQKNPLSHSYPPRGRVGQKPSHFFWTKIFPKTKINHFFWTLL